MGKSATLPQSVPGLRRMLLCFWPQIWKQRMIILGSFLALGMQILLRLLEPWPLKLIFDRVIPVTPVNGSSSWGWINALTPNALLIGSAIALVVIISCRAATSYFSTVGFALAGNRVLTEVRGNLFDHLQRLSLSYHNKAKSGDLLTRVIGDIGRVQEVAVTAMMPLLVHIITFIAMVTIMLTMNWRLGLIALSIMPLFFLATKILGGKIRTVSRQQRQREGAMGATAAEAISAIKVVQSLSLEDIHSKQFSKQNASSLKEGVQAKRLSARLERSVDILTAVGMALVLWFGAKLVMNKELTPGDLLVFLAYLKSSFKPMRDLAKYTGRIAKAAASGERIVEIMDTEIEIQDRPDAVIAPEDVKSVAFEEVIFAYDSGHNALDGVTIRAKQGALIALAGESGAGKSTAVGLLCRLHDPNSGCVTLNGRDIREYTVDSLRGRVSIVPQDNILFGVSVRENIAYGNPEANDETIESAARLARAHDFIMEMPEGYDTVVGERGETLSGGQRQRIAIARAVVRGAPILVLDEPTASLDEENASLVRAALHDLRQNRITIVIAHDLSTVREADCIYYLDQGCVLEQGSHEVLLRQNGRYAAMYRLQTGSSESDTDWEDHRAVAG